MVSWSAVRARRSFATASRTLFEVKWSLAEASCGAVGARQSSSMASRSSGLKRHGTH